MISSLEKVARAQSSRLILESYRQEIEKAIDNAKRTARDKWWRKQWYREAWQLGRQREREYKRSKG